MISQLLLATLGINTKTSTPQLDRERPGENRQVGLRVKVWFKHLETVGLPEEKAGLSGTGEPDGHRPGESRRSRVSSYQSREGDRERDKTSIWGA